MIGDRVIEVRTARRQMVGEPVGENPPFVTLRMQRLLYTQCKRITGDFLSSPETILHLADFGARQ